MRAKHVLLAVCSILLCVINTATASTGDDVTQGDQKIVQVLEDRREAIMALPHVVGVGIGKCGAEICIQILVTECSIEQAEQLEALLGDYPYRVEKTQPLQTLPSDRQP